MSLKELRGRQVTLFGTTFVLPKEIPCTDQEVIDREELISQIEGMIEEQREVVKLGEKIQKALRADIFECFEAQRARDKEGPDIIDYEEDVLRINSGE